MDNTAATEDNGRRVRGATKAERMFLDSEGAAHARTFPEVKAVRFKFVETGDELTMPLSDLPEGILHAAAAFGINTSVGNTFGAISDPAEAMEAAGSRWEQLCNGEWSAERTVGPRTSDVLEALCRFLKEAGKQVDEALRERLAEKLKDPAELKAVQADARVAVHVTAIKRERMEAKAKAQAQAAGEVTSGAADAFLNI